MGLQVSIPQCFMESFSEHVIVGQPHTFFLHLRDEDGHPVEAKSTSSFIECVIDRSVTISGDEDKVEYKFIKDTVRITFTCTSAGRRLMSLKVNHQTCPFFPVMVHAHFSIDDCSLEGDCLKGVTRNEPNKLKLVVDTAYPSPTSIMPVDDVKGWLVPARLNLTSREVACHLQPNLTVKAVPNEKYLELSFLPIEPGPYTILVMIDNEVLKFEPSIPEIICSTYCIIELPPPPFYLDKPELITVQFCDKSRRALTDLSKDIVGVQLDQKQDVFIHKRRPARSALPTFAWFESDFGLLNIVWTPSHLGINTLACKVNDEPVTAPFSRNIQLPFNCVLSGPGCANVLFIGVESFFVLTAAPAYQTNDPILLQNLKLSATDVSFCMFDQPISLDQIEALGNNMFKFKFVVVAGRHPLNSLRISVKGNDITFPQTTNPPDSESQVIDASHCILYLPMYLQTSKLSYALVYFLQQPPLPEVPTTFSPSLESLSFMSEPALDLIHVTLNNQTDQVSVVKLTDLDPKVMNQLSFQDSAASRACAAIVFKSSSIGLQNINIQLHDGKQNTIGYVASAHLDHPDVVLSPLATQDFEIESKLTTSAFSVLDTLPYKDGRLKTVITNEISTLSLLLCDPSTKASISIALASIAVSFASSPWSARAELLSVTQDTATSQVDIHFRILDTCQQETMASAAAVAAVVAATSKSMSPTVISSPTAYSSSSPLALISPTAGSPSSTRAAASFFNFSPIRTNQTAPTNTIHNLTSFAVMQISICNQDLAFPIYIQSMLDPEAVVIDTPSAFLAGSSSLCKLTLGNSAIKERINGVLPHVNVKASFLSLEEGSPQQHCKVESIHFCTQPGVYGPEIVPNQIDVVYSADKIGDYELQIMINNFEVPAIHITVGSLRAQQGKIRVIKPRVHEGEHARALLHMELRDDLNREIAFNIEQVKDVFRLFLDDQPVDAFELLQHPHQNFFEISVPVPHVGLGFHTFRAALLQTDSQPENSGNADHSALYDVPTDEALVFEIWRVSPIDSCWLGTGFDSEFQASYFVAEFHEFKLLVHGLPFTDSLAMHSIRKSLSIVGEGLLSNIRITELESVADVLCFALSSTCGAIESGLINVKIHDKHVRGSPFTLTLNRPLKLDWMVQDSDNYLTHVSGTRLAIAATHCKPNSMINIESPHGFRIPSLVDVLADMQMSANPNQLIKFKPYVRFPNLPRAVGQMYLTADCFDPSIDISGVKLPDVGSLPSRLIFMAAHPLFESFAQFTNKRYNSLLNLIRDGFEIVKPGSAFSVPPNMLLGPKLFGTCQPAYSPIAQYDLDSVLNALISHHQIKDNLLHEALVVYIPLAHEVSQIRGQSDKKSLLMRCLQRLQKLAWQHDLCHGMLLIQQGPNDRMQTINDIHPALQSSFRRSESAVFRRDSIAQTSSRITQCSISILHLQYLFKCFDADGDGEWNEFEYSNWISAVLDNASLSDVLIDAMQSEFTRRAVVESILTEHSTSAVQLHAAKLYSLFYQVSWTPGKFSVSFDDFVRIGMTDDLAVTQAFIQTITFARQVIDRFAVVQRAIVACGESAGFNVLIDCLVRLALDNSFA